MTTRMAPAHHPAHHHARRPAAHAADHAADPQIGSGDSGDTRVLGQIGGSTVQAVLQAGGRLPSELGPGHGDVRSATGGICW